jgi:pimeloyl-ACP methyl ester carboxylesterase
MPWRKATIDSDGVRLSVRDSGGRGRPLLLVHGLGLTQRSWGRVAHRLETRFRVVTYDQPGTGPRPGRQTTHGQPCSETSRWWQVSWP